MWEEPRSADFFGALTSFSRLILFDKRGTGLSDRDVAEDSLDDRMDDVRAVMDAAGSERAALFGYSEGGPMSMLFAATYPERVTALVLFETFARAKPAPDYPWGLPPEVVEDLTRTVEEDWGTGASIKFWLPALAGNPGVRSKIARWERMSGSPSAVLAILPFIWDIDVRPILSSLRVPTLVIHRGQTPLVSIGQGRYLAEHIPGARYVEQDDDSHLPWLGDAEGLVAAVEEFLVGARPARSDRVLATVMFSDIVGSTEQAARLGDKRWKDLLTTHDAVVRQEIERHRGREIKSLGDGALATFDGPGRAVRCACALRDALRPLGIDIRAGVHTGEIELRGDDVGGIGVHIAARVSSLAGAGEVLASRTVVDLVVGSGIAFQDGGEHELKGVPGQWRLFSVAS
jgi:class 3 adenylate cyclase